MLKAPQLPQTWHRRISPLQGKFLFSRPHPLLPSTTTQHNTITITIHDNVRRVCAHVRHSPIPAFKMIQADLLYLNIHLHNVFAAEEPADHQ
jgi:hypothetical protein